VSASFSGTNAINNAGLVIRRGAGTTIINGAPLNNTGTVRVEEGVLDLRSGGALGTYESAGGSLTITSGTYSLDPGSFLNQADLTLSNATLNILDSAAVGFTSLSATNSTIQFAVAHTLQNLNLTGSNLTGAGDVTVTGTFNWSGGTLAAGGKLLLAPGSVSSWTGSNTKGVNRTVENSGTLTYSGSNWFFNLGATSSGRVENLAGGTLIFDGDGDVSASFSGTNSITNAGLVIRRGAGTTTINSAPLASSGTVRIEAGVLDLPVGTTLDGTWDRDGGVLTLRNATFVIPSTAIFIPSALAGSNATLDFTGDHTLHTLTLDNAGVAGAGDVTVTGTFNWSGGTLAAGGKLLFAPGSVSSWTGSNTKGVNRTVENSGTLTYSGSNWFFNLGATSSGRVENLAGGTLIFDGDGDVSTSFTGTNAITNAGLVIRRGAGTTTITGLPFQNLATGTFQLENGTFQPSAGLTQNGVLAGSGILLANLQNNGILRPAPVPGGLTLQGNLTQTAAGRLELTLAGRDPTLIHRSLTVTGTATLSGTLAVGLEHPFAEAPGETFDVFSFASRTGDFTATEGLAANSGYDFNRAFTATTLQLSVATVGDVPAPAPAFKPALAESLAATDTDGDGQCDLLELAFGCGPNDAGSCRRTSIRQIADNGQVFPAIQYWERRDGLPVRYTIEYSTNLGLWQEADGREGRAGLVAVDRQPACPLADSVTVRLDRAMDRVFLRVRVSTK
jgi:phage baseplate assembly protein gpV